MSFADYQRQIEIVNDPAAVEQWKEQARNVTTYTTTRDEPPVTFNTRREAERHFRQNYLPGLIRAAHGMDDQRRVEPAFAGPRLGRAIEDAWAHETRSPSE